MVNESVFESLRSCCEDFSNLILSSSYISVVIASELQPTEHQLLDNGVLGQGEVGYFSKLFYLENCLKSKVEMNLLLLFSC